MSKRKYISPYWVITVLAIIATIYLGWQWWLKQGPEITISFEDATGIVPEQSGVYYRGVHIGKVTSVSLEDLSKVQLKASMHRLAIPLLKTNSKFWIARPEIGLKGIENLSTIASGSIIKVLPGSGAYANNFVGLEKSPEDKQLDGALELVLQAKKLGAVNVGTYLHYKGIETGIVTKVEISKDAKSVLVYAKIYNKFAKLINANTVFWNDSGIHASIHIFGASSVSVPPLDGLLHGTISFANPAVGKPTKPGQIYTLYSKKPDLKQITNEESHYGHSY